jgi:hypothetical protein
MTTIQIADYPFKNYIDFINALTEYLSNELYMEKYPNFAKMLDERFDNELYMFEIVKKLYNNDNSQFYKYMNVFLSFPNNEMKLSLLIMNIIHFYAINNSNSNNNNVNNDNCDLSCLITRLLTPEYNNNVSTFEEEVSNYHIRGLIIDNLISSRFCEEDDFNIYNGKRINWESFNDIDTYDNIKDNGHKKDYNDEMRFTHLRMYINHFNNY